MTKRVTPETIADAAIAIADAEGLDAVSMRRVGTALGVSGMALYRHVADRDTLLGRMAARVAAAEPTVPTEAVGWRPTLEHLASSNWRSFVRHPWLLQIVIRPGRLVDLLRAEQLETVLRRLEDAGLEPRAAFDTVVATSGIAVGIAGLIVSPGPDRRIEYAADESDPPRTTTDRATRARALPLDAEAGARMVDAAVGHYLDGLASSLHTTAARTRPRIEEEGN